MYNFIKISNKNLKVKKKEKTPDELLQAWSFMRTGENLGPNNFTTLYYKTFVNQLPQHLLKAFYTIIYGVPLPVFFVQDHMLVILQTCKDTTF